MTNPLPSPKDFHVVVRTNEEGEEYTELFFGDEDEPRDWTWGAETVEGFDLPAKPEPIRPADPLPCPFCGAAADPECWRDQDGKNGPGCLDCGATAEPEAWNRRAPSPAFVAMREALSYPRHTDTAHLLELAAKQIEDIIPEGCSSYFTPHLRRAAEEMRKALALAAQEQPQQ